MEKGTRVEVIAGFKGKGAVGNVFWYGPDKFSEGSFRIGIKTDEGQTFWISTDDVREVDAGFTSDSTPTQTSKPEPEKRLQQSTPQEANSFSRGMRVRWVQGEGTIFWAGASKYGDGVRLGIKDDNEVTHWLDGAEVSLIVEEVVIEDSEPHVVDDAPPPVDATFVDSTPPWESDRNDPGPEFAPPPFEDDDLFRDYE